VNADEREEIAASLAAHAELGPKYDSAVAEGLVERIGEEIDRRVDERLRSMGQQPSMPTHAANSAPRQAYLSPGQQIVPPGYHGQQAASAAAPGARPAPVPGDGAHPPARRGGVSGVFLGLGSIGLAVGATAVIASHHAASGAQVLMILLIWAAVAIINIAHSQRR
jgi:hypothetical protein